METATAAVLIAPQRLELTEIPLPATGADDGLLAVEACGLCGTDYDQWKGDWNTSHGYPIVPGHEVFGRIARIGEGARQRWGVDVGDRVVVEGAIPCNACEACTQGAPRHCRERLTYGLTQKSDAGQRLWGGYATHVYLHPNALLHRAPDDVPTGVMALWNPLANAVRWTNEVGRVGLHTSVLICGPGQRGLLALFVARLAGAGPIIVSGRSSDAARLAMARRLGATHTIDVDAEDLVERVHEVTGGRGLDVVVDVSSHAVEPVTQGIEVVRIGGRIVLAGIKGRRPLREIYSDTIAIKEIELVGVFASTWSSTNRALRLLAEHHQELAPLVSHSYRLGEITHAVRVLGREIVDGPELLNVHVRGEV